MSVESEILRIQHNVANAYAAVAEKRGEVPLQPTSANLAAAIKSIPAISSQSPLVSITVDIPPAKTVYKPGETFDPTGMIVSAHFEDGQIRIISNSSLVFTPAGPLSDTDIQVAVSLTVGGVTKSAAQPIIVNAYEWWSPHMTGYNTPSPYTVEVSSDGSQSLGWMAFDGNPNTYWNSLPSSTVFQYAIFGFGAPVTIKGIRIVTYIGIYPLYIPKQFSVYGSNDKENWVKIFTNDPSKESKPVAQENRDYIFSESFQYSFFKLQAESVNWSNDYIYIFDPADILFYKAEV